MEARKKTAKRYPRKKNAKTAKSFRRKPVIRTRKGSAGKKRAGNRGKPLRNRRRKPPIISRGGYPIPEHFCLSTSDWAAEHSAPVWPIYEGHVCDLRPPKGIDDQLHAVFRLEQFYSPPPYVTEIPNGRVWGLFGAVIAPDNRLLWDVSIFPPMIPSEHHIFRQTELPPIQTTDETVAVLTFCASAMYYHWMFDIMSRLHLLRQSGIQIDRYIINGGQYAFQSETLELFGIPREKMIQCDHTFHLQAKKLIVPVAPAIDWGPQYWQIQYLRNELLIKRGTEPIAEYERIYISRSMAGTRNLSNEEQVFEILRPLRFKLIHLETYSVIQQAQIFSSAKIVVAPHGSGLTNLIFCQKGTKVVELFASSFPVYVFWLICNQLELDYYQLYGEGERAPDKVDPERGYDNIEIDIEKFMKILELAGIRETFEIGK